MDLIDFRSSTDSHVPVACGNCDWTGSMFEVQPIRDFDQRIAPGETVPAGECPKCGALAHLGCEGCDGSGIRPDATPHAGSPPEGFVVIERCDTCQQHPDDLAAAAAWGTDARWQEGNGTLNAIAKPKAAPPAPATFTVLTYHD